jgi:glutathione S-transferase
MKLYHAAQSRSIRPRWVLEEVGAPYELARIDLAAGDQKRPEYLALNPNGAVPTLVDGDLVLYESAAICQYLADKFSDRRLAPPVGTPVRGLYYQWVHYAMASLEEPVVAVFLHTIRKPEAERVPAIAAEARAKLETVFGVIERALAGREYLLGREFSVADVMVGSTLAWARLMGLVSDVQPNLSAYLARLIARPAYQRATAD